MTNKEKRYLAPDTYWEELSVVSVLCESKDGEVPDYEPITGFEW